MGKFIDLTGKRFGKLVVVKRTNNKGKRVCWKCKCDCGNIKDVLSTHLISGNINNCGCLKKLIISSKNKTHGKSNTRIYKAYQHMKDRCYRQNDKRYKNYGARGIKVCEEWKNDFMSFYNWSMKNGYKEDLTIDRIDVNGNYEPSNCRWATWKEQANNTTRNHYITYKGEKHTISEWANLLNISPETLQIRLKRGWNIEDTIKIKKGGRRNATIK